MTAEKSPVYVGIEIIHYAGRLRRAFVYAALDGDKELLAIGHGDRNEILAYLGGQASAYAAITTPRSPNTGIVNQAATLQDELPFNKLDRPMNTRLCEYMLQDEGFAIDPTPSKATACPGWMRRGFNLFRRLSGFGYVPHPNEREPRHSLETNAEAIYWRLLHKKLPLPPSLEGRIQRQLILYEHQLPVPDAMNFFLEVTRFKLMHGDLPDENIHSMAELNALAAAYLAWQAALEPEKIELLGDPDEGQIVLPIAS